MDLLWAYALVFIFAAVPFFEGYAVVPLAIIAGLSPVLVIILGFVGNILTVLLLIIFIDKVKQWRKKRKGEENSQQSSKRSLRAKKIWEKYGLPGLALIGPLFVGSHLTAFMSVSFGGTKKLTAYWMTASLIVWITVFTILGYLGIDFMGLGEMNLFNEIIKNQ
ncbi:small multi-drug export protein [Bacillus sp. Marseille-P3661]|uniref:small multi-drug export protein n=1 Tax=Bacillus sp. Marseille-P3661 TaxID=1936234 RepID=UPI0035B507A5